MSTPLSRRNLFRLKLGDWVHLVRETRSHPDRETPAPFRPPGASPVDEEFLATCERCGACANACPYGVIEKLGPLGGDAEGTPVLHPDTNPCHWCPDMPCIQACPSGALARLPGRMRIGGATLDLDRCLNRHGTLCDTCALHCPASIGAITLKLREPHIDPDRCVGCGLCAFHCEAEPTAFDLQR